MKWKTNRIKAFKSFPKKTSQVFFDKGDLIVIISDNYQKEDLAKDLFEIFLSPRHFGDSCDKSKLVVENPR